MILHGFHMPDKVFFDLGWFPSARQGFPGLWIVSKHQTRLALILNASQAPHKVFVDFGWFPGARQGFL